MIIYVCVYIYIYIYTCVNHAGERVDSLPGIHRLLLHGGHEYPHEFVR